MLEVQTKRTKQTNKFKFNTNIYNELILSSGGIRGIYHLTMLEELSKYNNIYNFKYYTGCSVGSYICVLVLLGYSLEDIKKIAIDIDYMKFIDLKLLNLLSLKGFDAGYGIHNFLKALFLQKNISPNITFQDFYNLNKKNLTITVLNITTKNIEHHNYINTPNISVVLSLRMSMCVPFLFSPIQYNNNEYIDGALLEPYPYYYNKDTKKIGVFLDDDDIFGKNIEEEKSTNIYGDTLNYMFNLVYLVWENQIINRLNKKLPKNTVRILDKVKGVNFNLNKEAKMRMYEKGKRECSKFMKNKFKRQNKKLLLFKYFCLWRRSSF